MRSLKLLLLSTLLAIMVWLTAGAAWSSHKIFAAFEAAQTEVLGTIRCTRQGEDQWSGSVRIVSSYVHAHGLSLVQPARYLEPWKDLRITGELVNDRSQERQGIDLTGDAWKNQSRTEILIATRQEPGPATLSVTISGLRNKIEGDELRLDVVNLLCGCEKMGGVVLAIVTAAAGLVALLLAIGLGRAAMRDRIIKSPV
ncbi:MAG: hypothetical protein JNM99_11075 [Verrucomicrobiaceae bacterium]|nr:hypothetical protein [Verrucomicrobiaceae bacterium]